VFAHYSRGRRCRAVQIPPPPARIDSPTGAPPKGTLRGYVFRDGPIGELLALFSLFLEARFYLLSISDRASAQDSFPVKRELQPLRGTFGPDLDEVIFSGTDRNFATGLGPFLDEIRSIPSEKHQAVAFAANHYARALRQIGIDDEMVFVRLVSAVESVNGQQTIPDVRVDGRTLEQRLGLCQLTDDERKEFEKLIQTRMARQRFVAFLEEFSRGFFDREAREPELTQVTQERLGGMAWHGPFTTHVLSTSITETRCTCRCAFVTVLVGIWIHSRG
jgi:hypothetical protein